jgi:hypothetical protein
MLNGTKILPILSDPTSEDGDGDGYDDFDEIFTYHTCALCNEVMVIAKLNNEYISVLSSEQLTSSYGGNQGWFEGDMCSHGCGLISSCDILLYLSYKEHCLTYPLLSSSSLVPSIINHNKYIYYYEYLNFVNYYYNEYLTITSDFDTRGTKIANALEDYINYRGIECTVKWGYFNSVNNTLNGLSYIAYAKVMGFYNINLFQETALFDKDGLILEIKNMLNNDIPVMLAIGPDCPEDLKLYPNSLIISDISQTRGHYVTITSLLYNKINNKYILEISSWGKRYYIDYDEYVENADIFSGITKISFTNRYGIDNFV